MAEGTVRGAFDLDVSPALRGVRDYRREAARADVQTKQLGGSIDKVFGPSTVARIKTAREEMSGLADTSRTTRLAVRDQWKGMNREIQREAASIVSTIAVVRDRMRQLGQQTARPHIDVSGITAAITQIELLTARLQALGAVRSTPRVGIGGGGIAGGVARAGRGGGRGGSGSGIVNLGGVGFAGIRGRSLLAAGAVALPAVQALGGGAGALLGSAGSAALGAGATGLGGMAPLLAGIGAVMSVAKPAGAALKEVLKAQDAYSKAVRDHGRWSDQATKAQRELTRVQRLAGPGSGYAAQQRRGFGQDWRRLTRPAQQQYFGLQGDVAQIGRRIAPGLARNALTATTAVRQQGTRQARFLAGDRAQNDLAFFTRAFARELPTAERTLENVERTMLNIARASVPFFHEANVWVREQTAGWRSTTTNIGETRRRMEPLVRSAKDWARLTGSTFRLLRDIGRMGRPEGDSMVRDLSATFDRWDAWIQGHPEQTASFFRDTSNSVREMASGLAGVVRWLNQMATVMRPLLDRFSQLVGLVSHLGLIGTPGVIGALLGGVRAFRGGAAGAAGGSAAAMSGVGAGAAVGAGAGALVAARGGAGRGAARGPGRAGTVVYGSGFRYGAPQSQVGRRGAVGAIQRGAGRVRAGAAGALRGYAPIALGLGALDFASTDGTVTQRLQQALSSMSLGLVPGARTAGMQRDAGIDEARRSAAGLGSARGLGDLRQQIATLEARRAGVVARSRTSRGGGLFGGSGALGLFDSGRGGDSGPTKEEAQKNVAKAAEYAKVIKELRMQEEALSRTRKAAKDDLSRRNAAAYGGRLDEAYGVYRGAGQSREQAGMSTAAQVTDRLKKTRDAGVETLGEASLQWASALAKRYPEMKGTVDRLTGSIEARFKRMGKTISIVNGDILTGSISEWKGIRSAMSDPVEQAREKMMADFTAIQNKAVGSLVAMGYAPGDAKGLVAGLEKGGSRGEAARNVFNKTTTTGTAVPYSLEYQARAQGKRARGGVIGGRGLMDTVPVGDVMAAPGEAWIANRHTLDKLSMATRATFGLTAEQMIRGETRRHSMPKRATGGVAGGIGSAVGRVLGQFPGLSVTSTTGGRHAANSYHYRGMAADIGGPPGLMNQAAAWIARVLGSSLTEGIHNPNLSIASGQHVPPSHWGASTWAEHADHIHMAVAGALGAGGAGGAGAALGGMLGQVALQGVGRKQPGVPGAVRQRAGDIFAAGLSQKLNAAIGGGGGSVGAMGGGSWARQVAAAGLPAVFNAIIAAESGGNPGARNASGASGLTQIMMPLHAGLVQRFGGNVFDPMTNLRVARHLYGQSGLAPWAASRHAWGSSAGGAATGRKVAWAGAFDRGGEFTTNGPTAFMAGEGPRNRKEVVSVTAAGRAGAGVSVVFQAGAIVVQAGAGGKVDAEKVGEQVAAKILDALRKNQTASVIG